MSKLKVSKKSTDTDMTPFVDIGFLILSFFIMATKFKPQEPVEITTPNSVNTVQLPKDNAVLISIDKTNKVYFSVLAEKDPNIADALLQDVAINRNMAVTPEEKKNFRTAVFGMPFTKMKGFLDLAPAEQAKVSQDGIPVLDSATNELVWWIASTKKAFAGQPLKYLIKGDGASTYPTFKAIIDALKRNDELKYNLVTMPEDAPVNSELTKYNDAVEAMQKK